MADVTITIPPAEEQRVRDAITIALGLDQPAVMDDLRQYIINDIKQLVRNTEKREASKTAADAIIDVPIT